MILQPQSFIVSSDYPDRGILRVEGKDALDLLHRLSTADLLRLKLGECCPTVFTTEKGRIIDYVLVGREKNSIILLASSGREEQLKNWIEKYTIMEDVRCTIITDQFESILALGPHIPVKPSEVFGISREINTCSFFEGGFSFVVQDFGMAWTRVFCSTRDTGVSIRQSISTEKTHTLSSEEFEAFLILHGIPGAPEFRDEFNPFEAGIAHAISFTKGCYIGQEVIARLDTYKKIQRRLVGLRVDSSLPMIMPVAITHNGADAGWITSLAQIRTEGGFPGLGIMRNEVALGDSVTFVSGNAATNATLVQFHQFQQTAHLIQ